MTNTDLKKLISLISRFFQHFTVYLNAHKGSLEGSQRP